MLQYILFIFLLSAAWLYLESTVSAYASKKRKNEQMRLAAIGFAKANGKVPKHALQWEKENKNRILQEHRKHDNCTCSH